MTNNRPPHSHHWNLSTGPAVAPRLVSRRKRNLVSSVCRQTVTASFTSAFVVIRLPASCFLRGPKMSKSLGPILPTKGVSGYDTAVGRSWTMLPTSPTLCPVIKKLVAGKPFATNIYAQQAVISWPRTFDRFLLRLDTIPGGTVKQMFKCQYWLHEGAINTICYTCACKRQNKAPDISKSTFFF
jgi:hypothetical protein